MVNVCGGSKLITWSLTSEKYLISLGLTGTKEGWEKGKKWQVVNSCWVKRHLLKEKPRLESYRGLGSFSSGNGVHTESGVFCSLNRPENTFSMSAMEKAHTADPGILWRKKYINAMSMFDFVWSVNLKTNSSHGSPVHLCGEHTHHRGNSVDVDDVSDGLEHIEVEERLSWHGAIQSRLHKRRPVLLQHPLWPTDVILTDPGHTGIHNLRGAGV